MLWGHRNDPVNFHRCLQDSTAGSPTSSKRSSPVTCSS